MLQILATVLQNLPKMKSKSLGWGGTKQLVPTMKSTLYYKDLNVAGGEQQPILAPVMSNCYSSLSHTQHA